MGTTHINITDDFDARKIFECMGSYSRGGYNKDKIEFHKPTADRTDHDDHWEEEIYDFLDLKTTSRLKLHSYPTKPIYKGLPSHTLEIEVSGEEQEIKDTLRNIERITGIRINKSLIP